MSFRSSIPLCGPNVRRLASTLSKLHSVCEPILTVTTGTGPNAAVCKPTLTVPDLALVPAETVADWLGCFFFFFLAAAGWRTAWVTACWMLDGPGWGAASGAITATGADVEANGGDDGGGLTTVWAA